MGRRRDERSYWDSVSPTYDELYRSRWSQGEDEKLQEWLREAIGERSQARVLDIGCGTGLAYSLIRQILPCSTYMGIDVSEGMLRKFREKFGGEEGFTNVELRLGDARDLACLFAEARFDLVVLTNTAGSYAGPPTKLLRDCRRILSNEGALFVSFLNRSSLRRCVTGKKGAREVFNTRGADSGRGGVRATVPTGRELVVRCRRVGLQVKWLRYQSVLGGVAEMDWLRPVEAIAARLTPRLGHTINILAQKGP